MPARARLYLRGRIYWTWFYVGTRKVCRSTRCRTERAAAVVAARFEREAASPAAPGVPADQATVRHILERLQLDREERGRSDATLRYYEQKAGQLMRVLGEATPVDEVTAKVIDDYVSQRLREGAKRTTVGKELGTYRSAMRLARRRGETTLDPATVLPIGFSPEYEPRKRWLSPAEIDALLDELPARAGHVAFFVVTGARDSEATRHEREDWNWKSKPPLVRLRGTKRPGAARTVPVLPHVLGLAKRAYAAAAPKGRAFEPWSNIRRDLAAACERAGIPRCSPNDLRRTAGQWLRELVGSADLVADFLGHVDDRMVRRVYGKLEGERLGKVLLDACSKNVARSRTHLARHARGAR